MPVYEYECKHCGRRFDKIQSFTAEPLAECVLCGQGPVRRVLQPVGVIFKGSGWYINDSRNNKSAESKTAATKPEKTTSKDESSPASTDSSDAPAETSAKKEASSGSATTE